MKHSERMAPTRRKVFPFQTNLEFIRRRIIQSHRFHYTFHSLELRCDEVEAIVQVAFCRHLLQVGEAVVIPVCKVVRHETPCRTAKAKRSHTLDVAGLSLNNRIL